MSPLFACIISGSSAENREIIAVRRMPPLTAAPPMRHMMSWTSIERICAPCRARIMRFISCSMNFSGSGPEARPPFVINGVPAGRMAEKSNLISRPSSHHAVKARVIASAQPSEVSEISCRSRGTSRCGATNGNRSTYWCSTEKPTPHPDIEMMSASGKARRSSTGI